MDTTVQNLFTPSSMATLGGASVAVMVITNTLRSVFKLNSPIVGFVTALVVAFFGAIISGALHTFVDFVVAIVNGFLLYSSAAGIQETAVRTAQSQTLESRQATAPQGIKWLSSWFH
ncbi:MAG TPA: hypothetical protein VEO56_06440 [Bacteroidota bacterium]|nr:hypothetical protein [Bacteroidota bacterium]